MDRRASWPAIVNSKLERSGDCPQSLMATISSTLALDIRPLISRGYHIGIRSPGGRARRVSTVNSAAEHYLRRRRLPPVRSALSYGHALREAGLSLSICK